MKAAMISTKRMGRIKAPYDKKTAIIRAKMLPKGLYGCESCPINDSILRTWRTETFAAASQGTDIDPEIHVYTKRAMSLRRAYYVSKSNAKLIDENFELYKKAEEPGIIKKDQCMTDHFSKMIAEEPGSSRRTKMRR